MKVMCRGIVLVIITMLALSLEVGAQDDAIVYQTFKDRRIVNSHSVETLKAGQLDVRIGHRFGDLLGDSGGWDTFYGLENAADILLGVDYGFSDNFMLGLFRSKGSGPLKQNLTGQLKWKVAAQKKQGLPFSVTLVSLVTASTMSKTNNKGALNYFPKFAHRLSYHAEILVAKKFSSYFSGQLVGGFTYRNIVPATDVNLLPSVGAALRLQVTKPFAILLDGRYIFNGERSGDFSYQPSYGIGFEFETGGGHIFQMNVVNSGGMMETDYIPNTTQDPSKGEFRMGFTISRLFRI